MVNKVILVGNLGRDPERRSTPSGQQVATFSVATSRRWRDRDGNRQEQTEWHNVVVWGRQAEVAGEYLKKGRQVFIEGRLQTRSWDDKQTGQKRSKLGVVCENFRFVGPAPAREGGAPEAARPRSAAAPQPAPVPADAEPPPPEEPGDDVPF